MGPNPCKEERLVEVRNSGARIGLLAAATALIALLLAAPAGAAQLSGGTIKVDIKPLTKKGIKATFSGAASKSKTAGTYTLGLGNATLVAQSSGNIPFEGGSIKLAVGKKNVTLKSLQEKLAAGKGQLTAKIGSKRIAIFDQASSGKVGSNAGFVGLHMNNSNATLTKAGAGALNKALGLKKSKALKNKFKSGSGQFNAIRLLTVVGGTSTTTYNTAFYDKLKNDCDDTLGSLAPATAIPVDADHPRGGVMLPIKPGGTLRADNLQGSFAHDGGTTQDRPAASPKGPEYHSTLTNITFSTQSSPPALLASSSDLPGPPISIGTVGGAQLSALLTETGGTVSISNGSLILSDFARQALGTFAKCDVPADVNTIGVTSTTANVQ
jgi:hypothetical protein